MSDLCLVVLPLYRCSQSLLQMVECVTFTPVKSVGDVTVVFGLLSLTILLDVCIVSTQISFLFQDITNCIVLALPNDG